MVVSENYEILENGFYLGNFYEKGQTISLFHKQATPYLMENRIRLMTKPTLQQVLSRQTGEKKVRKKAIEQSASLI